MKREIYGVVVEKFICEGGLRVLEYKIGAYSFIDGKVPQKIEEKDGKIIVTFTDNSRHIIPYTDSIEIFDREIKPKTDANRESTANEKPVK